MGEETFPTNVGYPPESSGTYHQPRLRLHRARAARALLAEYAARV
jgi:hypothetical protein